MTKQLSRRKFLQRTLVGGAALFSIPLLEACSSQAPAAPTPSSAGKPAAAPTSAPAVAATSAPAAGAAPTVAAKPGGTPIKIGIGAPLSGPFIGYGTDFQNAVELALRDSNRQALGRPVEVIIEDTEGKADVAIRKFEKLVTKDGAKFVAGWATSAEALAIVDKLAQNDAIFMAPVSQTTKLTGEACNKYVFRIPLNDQMLMDIAAVYLDANPQLKSARWSILAADYEYGRDSAAAFKKLGVNVVSEDYAPLGTKDFGTYINKLQGAKPDAVFLVEVGQDLINVVKQAAGFGLLQKMKFINPSTMPEFALKPVGDASLGLLNTLNYTWTIDTPENKQWVERYKTVSKGELPSQFSANMYVAIRWLLTAIEKAGATDSAKVISALEQTEYKAPWTTYRFRKEDHQTMIDGYMAEVVKNTESPYGVAQKVLFTAPADKIAVPLDKTGCKGV